MTTGVSKNKWQEDTAIVTNESYEGDYSYKISYVGKISEKNIIGLKNNFEYTSLLNQKQSNKIYFGDNLDVLRNLIYNSNLKGKVKLIYIDPPYGTNSIFQSRNQKSSYKDDLIGSHYLEFMRRRLILLRELLSDDGSIYVHLDGNMTFQMKVLLDEIFESKNFRGFITRKKCSTKNSTRKTYGNISDYILYYSKTDNYTWQRATVSWPEDKIKKEYPCIDESTGRRYKKVPIHAPGIRNGETGKKWKGMLPPPGKHWQYIPEKLTKLDNKGEIYWSANGNPRRKLFLDIDKGIPVQDIWMDIQDSLNQNIKITGYPTEKNPHLLERIIKASSNEGDIILDCFAGSGTTLDVAEQLGRKFIGIDNSSVAIYNIVKRFVIGLEKMGDYVSEGKNQRISFTQPSLLLDSRKYTPHLKYRHNFDVLADSRFIQIITEILNEFGLVNNLNINKKQESNLEKVSNATDV